MPRKARDSDAAMLRCHMRAMRFIARLLFHALRFYLQAPEPIFAILFHAAISLRASRKEIFTATLTRYAGRYAYFIIVFSI
jgi:hypothetical protein